MNKKLSTLMAALLALTIATLACSPVDWAVGQAGYVPAATAAAPAVSAPPASGTVPTLAPAAPRAEDPCTPAPGKMLPAYCGSAPVPTAAPAAPAAGSGAFHDRIKGLKYQPVGSGACTSVPNPGEYPSCLFQNVQSGDKNAVQVVQALQALVTTYQTPNFEGVSVTFANTQAVIAWCPAGVQRPYPPDTAKPLSGTIGAQYMDHLFVVDAGTGGASRTITSANPAEKCWVAYRY